MNEEIIYIGDDEATVETLEELTNGLEEGEEIE